MNRSADQDQSATAPSPTRDASSDGHAFWSALAGLSGFGLVLGMGAVALVGMMDPPAAARASLADRVDAAVTDAAFAELEASTAATPADAPARQALPDPVALPLYETADTQASADTPSAADASVSVPVANAAPAPRPGDSIFAPY